MIRHIKAEIIHLVTPNQFQDDPRLHWRMNLTNREIRYSNWNFIPGIICCIVSYFFKKIFQCILYLKKDHRPASNSFPLKIVNTDSLYAFDLGQNPFAATYIGHIPFDEPQETKAIFTVLYKPHTL
jgi:hypothetical protein